MQSPPPMNAPMETIKICWSHIAEYKGHVCSDWNMNMDVKKDCDRNMEYAKSNNLKCLGTRTSVDNGDIIMGFRGNSSLAKSVHTNIKV